MATRGVTQLQKLTLKYCEYGGSSRAMRDYIANGQLAAWMEANIEAGGFVAGCGRMPARKS